MSSYSHLPEFVRGRREFLKLSGVAAAASGLLSTTVRAAGQDSARPPQSKPLDPVRIGLVGAGNRGSSLCSLLLDMEGVEVRAVADLDEARAARIQQSAQAKGRVKPDAYCRGEHDFERLCARDDLDLVLAATPWRWHTPICVAAMRAGKHAATEVPAAQSLDECWQLVDTAEKTGRHCLMLENICYARNTMMVLNMIRQGLLGEIVHAQAGYQHDLRGYAEDTTPGAEPSWRRQEALKRNGNLYPTHPIGPVAWWMNINRGDRFDYLVSVSSKSVGVNAFFARKLGADHLLARQKLTQGDVNVTIIHTVNGCTVTLYYDTHLPRPYDPIFRAQGTQGIYSGSLNEIYIDPNVPAGSPKPDAWEAIEPYATKYDHPLWKQLESQAQGKGHGGSDYLMLHRVIRALRTGTAPDQDVYDAATWSAIVSLSEKSVAGRGQSVDFPDFTRGRWQKRAPVEIASTQPA